MNKGIDDMQDVHTPYPAPRIAWTLVILLALAYMLSFVDRYILGLLIEPVKRDLHLSDEQIGWVLGPAFAIFYATMGLPLGWLADRSRRTWLVGAGIAVWSIATAMSGLARDFIHLFITRMCVGVGEATLGPSAMSMISDSFPPERRGKPISVYVSALSVGGGIASLVGGGVLIWAKTTESISFPGFGMLAPWQLTFFVVGAPGVLLSLAFFLVREPVRRVVKDYDPELKGNGVADALAYVWRHKAAFFGFISLACAMNIIAYSQGFLAPTFERSWGWPAEKYGLVNGCVLLLVGPITVFLTGYLSDRWMQAGVKAASFKLLIIGYLIMMPTSVLPMLMPSAELAFVFLAFNTIGIGMVSAMAVASLLMITPSKIRAQLVALFYMGASMTGLFLGPTTIGVLSTRVFGEENIRYAMATLPLLYGTIPLLLIPFIKTQYYRQLDRLSVN